MIHTTNENERSLKIPTPDEIATLESYDPLNGLILRELYLSGYYQWSDIIEVAPSTANHLEVIGWKAMIEGNTDFKASYFKLKEGVSNADIARVEAKVKTLPYEDTLMRRFSDLFVVKASYLPKFTMAAMELISGTNSSVQIVATRIAHPVHYEIQRADHPRRVGSQFAQFLLNQTQI
jgi:hypothetical protein